jgi:hypothetical protein
MLGLFGQNWMDLALGSPNPEVIRTELDGILHLIVRILSLFGQNSMDLVKSIILCKILYNVFSWSR